MRYITPDGTVLKSLPYPQVVTHTCNSTGLPDGVYISYETTSAVSEYGIQQVKITRIVEDNVMRITLVESNNQELEEYLNSIKSVDNGSKYKTDFY